MQAAEPPNQLMARPQIKMIRVGENDFRAQLFERLLREGFDGSLRANGQKKRRLHYAVGRGQAPTARARRVGFQNFKRKRHAASVSGSDEGDSDANHDVDCPDGEGDTKRLCTLQLPGVYRGKADRDQDQRPKSENID